jgi:hypothetical protein
LLRAAQVAGVIAKQMADNGRQPIPVFCDKHLAYDFVDAQWMWDRALELGIPLMAGSSLPVAYRSPFLEHPKEQCCIDEAVGVGFGAGGSFEAYGFHTLETMQCMAERRKGGESGVLSVQTIEGEAVWAAIKSGEISADLVDAACNAIVNNQAKRDGTPQRHWSEFVPKPAALLLRYTDGMKASILWVDGWASCWS